MVDGTVNSIYNNTNVTVQNSCVIAKSSNRVSQAFDLFQILLSATHALLLVKKKKTFLGTE